MLFYLCLEGEWMLFRICSRQFLKEIGTFGNVSPRKMRSLIKRSRSRTRHSRLQKSERQIERHCRMVLQSVGRLFEKDKALTAVRDKGTVLKFPVVTVCFCIDTFPNIYSFKIVLSANYQSHVTNSTVVSVPQVHWYLRDECSRIENISSSSVENICSQIFIAPV